MKFPSLLPVHPFSGSAMMRRHYYKVVLPYQLRRWYRIEVRPLFCSHKVTHRDIDWGHAYVKCSKCYKILEDLRKEK